MSPGGFASGPLLEPATVVEDAQATVAALADVDVGVVVVDDADDGTDVLPDVQASAAMRGMAMAASLRMAPRYERAHSRADGRRFADGKAQSSPDAPHCIPSLW